MHLTPREQDKLLSFTASELARRRRARGLKLNYPEALALITAEILEGIRDQGISVLLVEQYLEFAWRLASAYAIMRKGTIVSRGATKDLRQDMVRQHLTV